MSFQDLTATRSVDSSASNNSVELGDFLTCLHGNEICDTCQVHPSLSPTPNLQKKFCNEFTNPTKKNQKNR